MTKLISQIPHIIHTTQEQIKSSNQNIQDKIQNIDSELNLLKNSDFCLAEYLNIQQTNKSIFQYAIEYGNLSIVKHFI